MILQQLGTSPSASTLTYLRLGFMQAPHLDYITKLTKLRRLHMHQHHALVRPLGHLTRLTYLHLHGGCEELHRALPRLTLLKKLSLGKAKVVTAEDVSALARALALTSLELPLERGAMRAENVNSLARLVVRFLCHAK
jgi:hypothetical protein